MQAEPLVLSVRNARHAAHVFRAVVVQVLARVRARVPRLLEIVSNVKALWARFGIHKCFTAAGVVRDTIVVHVHSSLDRSPRWAANWGVSKAVREVCALVCVAVEREEERGEDRRVRAEQCVPRIGVPCPPPRESGFASDRRVALNQEGDLDHQSTRR